MCNNPSIRKKFTSIGEDVNWNLLKEGKNLLLEHMEKGNCIWKNDKKSTTVGNMLLNVNIENFVDKEIVELSKLCFVS